MKSLETRKTKQSVRFLALEALLKIERDHAYSHLLVNHAIEQGGLKKKDVPLFTEMVYGTVQRKKTLDYYLKPFLPKKIKQKDQWILSLLRLSLYQMLYLDRVPDRAIIYEAVEIAKMKGHRGLSSVVNGILRNIQRQGVRDVDNIANQSERIAVKYSHPRWLVSRWIKQYGVQTTTEICNINLTTPVLTARVNTAKGTVDDIIEKLKTEGIEASRGNLVSEAIQINNGNVVHSEVYRQGFLTIQDESSMLVTRALNINKHDRVLDCCAAPGGKTTHIAEWLAGSGEVYSLDLHKHKVKLIVDHVKRLQLENVKTLTLDARQASKHFPTRSFDKLLVDAPCSGFGVVRRKPDIKWRKQPEDVKQMAALQLDILLAVAPLLKENGILVYSTCTIEKQENEDIISAFLKKQPHFQLDESLVDRLPTALQPYADRSKGHIQMLPHYFRSDGFFIAALKKTSHID